MWSLVYVFVLGVSVVFGEGHWVSHNVGMNVINYIETYIREGDLRSTFEVNTDGQSEQCILDNQTKMTYAESDKYVNQTVSPRRRIPYTLDDTCRGYGNRLRPLILPTDITPFRNPRVPAIPRSRRDIPDAFRNPRPPALPRTRRDIPDGFRNPRAPAIPRTRRDIPDALFRNPRVPAIPRTRRQIQTTDENALACVASLRKPCDYDFMEFHKKWSTFVPIFTIFSDSTCSIWSTIRVNKSVELMGTTDAFINIFWPFRLDVARLNQNLGLYGITGLTLDKNLKTNFFKALRSVQNIEIPVSEERVILSFDDPALVNGLRRTNLVPYSKTFIESGKHRFSDTERLDIEMKTSQAMQLIQATSSDLYKAINQLVACIAYYKSETPDYISGTIPNTIGVLWMDPSGEGEWSVPFYAEQIVHEFTHTAILYAELVHGAYARHDLKKKVKTMSSIRRVPRNFDGSFHAAYVSAGLVAFHARAGNELWAEKLARTLRSSVDELVEKNRNMHVLDESGNAMLQFLADFVQITRMEREE